MTDPDIDNHGTDPHWTRREIARAEAQDAKAFGSQAFAEMNRRTEAAEYRAAARNALGVLGQALGVIALIALSGYVVWQAVILLTYCGDC